ncbi:hypothetical protein [Clostridium chrysemydis]|uniref:hypothetical protein n=1 Tax=Clostridium chrysemydis TaxID=2665504 RepID=UPI001883B992|nr:hypothetical protein [Clostridium chrysemydis]
MKKIISFVLTLVISVGILVSCGTDNTKKDVTDFFDSYKALDFNNINQYAVNGNDISKVITQFESYDEKRENALRYWVSKISYKIGEVKDLGNDEAEVKVTINALDGNVIYKDYEEGIKSMAPARVNNDIKNPINSSEEDYTKTNYSENNYGNIDYVDEFIAALENQTVPMKETTVLVKLKKADGKYKIQNDDEVLQAMLGGLPVSVILG